MVVEKPLDFIGFALAQGRIAPLKLLNVFNGLAGCHEVAVRGAQVQKNVQYQLLSAHGAPARKCLFLFSFLRCIFRHKKTPPFSGVSR
jgi:hypothetical protein